MNGHRIQWNGHRIQWNGHRIQWNGHWIQMNSHWNQEEIGQIATDFDEWSSKSGTNWSKQSPPNTISHSVLYSVKFQLISMNVHRNKKQFGRNNHLQLLFHTHSYILSYRKKGSAKCNHLQTLSKQVLSKNFKPSQAKSVREKKGRPSFENSMNGHFSACGIRREFLDNLGTWLKLTVYSSS